MCETTCQPMIVRDRQHLEDEIVIALEAQGSRITTNAVGEHWTFGRVNITKLAQDLKRVVIEVTMMDPYLR